MSEQNKFFQNVQTYVDQAAGFTKLPKGLIEQIKICNAVYQINFPVKIKNEIKFNSKVSIYGYADRKGTPEYNKDLANKRIEETVKYLQINPANVSKYPIGSDELIYDNNTPQGRSYSRTVRIIIATPVK